MSLPNSTYPNEYYLELFQVNRRLGIDQIYLDHKRYFIQYLEQYYPIVSDLDMIYSDAVLVLIEKLSDPAFQLTCKIQTYLNAIGKNQLFKRINRQKEVSNLPDYFDCNDWLEDVELEDITAQEYAIFKEVFNKMAEARSKCYQLFQLFYYQKSSLNEIALALGYSTEANARQQKYKCLLRLRAHIHKLLAR
jgi:RNA polymerase sigma factor (sigma-70 family)